jgi:hypothetical protein
MYVALAKVQRQNLVHQLLFVVNVTGQAFKLLGKAHLLYNKFAELVMAKEM